MRYFKGQTIPAHKDTIMIHCLATSKDWGRGKTAKEMMKIVTRWHVVERKWRAVAYAAIIDYEGGFALGRDLDGDGNVLEETAAAARGWNTNAIHLALAGGRGSHEKDDFSENYTPEQDTTLRAMIAEIEGIAGRKMELKGHNETAAKACPGFQVSEWFAQAPLAKPTPEEQAPSAWAGLIAALMGLFGGKRDA